jgi:hypothetical protein
MTYYLFTDKPNKFNCNIEIEGTSLAQSKVRLVIETDEMSYMFNGKIENTGICEVNIPKTKHFLPENTKGLMRLEVIADDVYFEPWSSDFNVKTTKKVNIVVAEQVEDERPKLKVEVFQPKEETKVVNETKIKQEKQKTSNDLKLTKQDILKLFKR